MPTAEETNEPVTTKKPRARKEVARELASHLRVGTILFEEVLY